MPTAKKGTFSVVPKEETYVFCMIDPKHIQLIIVVLAVLGAFISTYLYTHYHQDFVDWMNEEEPRSFFFSPAQIETIWVKPGLYVSKNTKLLTISLDCSNENGKALKSKLIDHTQSQIQQNKVYVDKLIKAHDKAIADLKFELSIIDRLIMDLMYFGKVPKRFKLTDWSKEKMVIKLKEEAYLLSVKISHLPSQLNEQVRKNNWLRANLSEQLNNIKHHSEYTLLAMQPGEVGDVYITEGDYFYLDKVLFSLTKQEKEQPENVYIIPPLTQRVKTMVDLRFRKANFPIY